MYPQGAVYLKADHQMGLQNQVYYKTVHEYYILLNPVIFPVIQPSGVCVPDPRGPTPPPTPSDSGFVDVYDSRLALAAAWTAGDFRLDVEAINEQERA